MNGPNDLTKLPESGTFMLPYDTRVDGADFKRFVGCGGTIVLKGYRLFVDGFTVSPGTAILGTHPGGNGGRGVGLQLHGTHFGGNGGRGVGVQLQPVASPRASGEPRAAIPALDQLDAVLAAAKAEVFDNGDLNRELSVALVDAAPALLRVARAAESYRQTMSDMATFARRGASSLDLIVEYERNRNALFDALDALSVCS